MRVHSGTGRVHFSDACAQGGTLRAKGETGWGLFRGFTGHFSIVRRLGDAVRVQFGTVRARFRTGPGQFSVIRRQAE